ncbi:STAS domain protein [Streptomyces sp. ADI96-02]|uniref:STAS domain-containing protein n=1 Tax=Streptomyces sp. ADI96-02 TaxID=1522760 RepID=UPI000F556062|nr:STAS domain-containing protein [Streptomyces sp. ADI96-02]RPK55526.1 STAS domain protein [Streptomyces sp. ADI96-02]
MTALPHQLLTVTPEVGPLRARLRLGGDLDYGTSDELVRRVRDTLAAQPELKDLHLDCAGLLLCDSMGVSALLQIHRDTTARRVRLHVEDRPAFLNRIMRITGILHLFEEEGGQLPARGGTDEASAEPRTSPGPPPSF